MTFGVTSNSPCVSQGNTRQFGRRIYQFIRSHLGLFFHVPLQLITTSKPEETLINGSQDIQSSFTQCSADYNFGIGHSACHIQYSVNHGGIYNFNKFAVKPASSIPCR